MRRVVAGASPHGGQVSYSNILNRLVIALMVLKSFHRTTHGHVMDAETRANFRHGVSAREVRPRHRFGAFGVALTIHRQA